MSFPTNLRYFRAREFDHPERMQIDFLHKLDRIRAEAGVPLIVTSDWRDDPSSAHATGYAVDVSDNPHGISVGSRWRYKVLGACYEVGIHRMGIYDRHIHIDDSPLHDREVVWSGISQ